MIPEAPAVPFVKQDELTKTSLSMQVDPRFMYDKEVEARAVEKMRQFINQKVDRQTIAVIRGVMMGVIIQGYEEGLVTYPAKEHPKDMKPRFKHDCSNCVYLGNGAVIDDKREADLYICATDSRKVIIVRYGNGEHNYETKSMSYKDSDLNVWIAVLLAEEAGLL